MLAPSLDQHLGLPEGIEDLSVEQFVSQLAIEALVVAVLPWTAGLDVEGFDANAAKPLAHRFGLKLRTVV